MFATAFIALIISTAVVWLGGAFLGKLFFLDSPCMLTNRYHDIDAVDILGASLIQYNHPSPPPLSAHYT